MPPSRPPRVRARLHLVLALIACALLAACGSQPAPPPSAGHLPDSQLALQLKSAVNTPATIAYLQALQKIADDNGGNRASPGPGYEASVDYVSEVLRAAGYDVTTPVYQLSDRDENGPATLRNVVAQTRTGDPAHVVLLGAHLDSVPKGPGIVDNGSGVATLLEIATRLGPSAPLRNAVRFAFFGSEETGSQGATAYVRGLSTDDRRAIMLYLNIDMVASPNGGYFVQGGAGEDRSESGPPGSSTISGVLADQLAKTGVNAEVIKFTGDDESPFVRAGIPSGGAANGDQKNKTDTQAQAWGGQEGQDFDPCYHKSCDRLDNVNAVVLDRYLHALAGTAAYFASSDPVLSG